MESEGGQASRTTTDQVKDCPIADAYPTSSVPFSSLAVWPALDLSKFIVLRKAGGKQAAKFPKHHLLPKNEFDNCFSFTTGPAKWTYVEVQMDAHSLNVYRHAYVDE